MEDVPFAFYPLVRYAKELLLSDPAADQVVVLQATNGRIVRLANHGIASGDTSDEVALIDALVKSRHTALKYGVCIWRGGAPDVPSRHLRNSLMLLNPVNRDAEFLINGTAGFTTRTLQAMQ